MADDTLAHARLYLALGFAVLPVHFAYERDGRRQCSCTREDCGQPAKHPFGQLVRKGVKDASTDPETVERWFTSTAFNIAIATGAGSGIFALDIDPRHGGEEALAALEAEHGALPATWRFLTGGGGEYILFRHPGRTLPNSAGALGPGIDVRCDGGAIVAPPSRHICGRPYAISVDHHPEEVALADAPDWLLNGISGSRPADKARKATQWRALTREGAVNGARNDSIAKLSGLLLGRRIDPHVCLDLMLAFNATRCSPPLPEDEVVATVASIARRDRSKREEVRSDG